MKIIKPYKKSEKSKKEQVAAMFDNIAHRYDFLNRFLSLNIDRIWRRKAINLLKNSQAKNILDIATGTGDFAIETVKIIKPENVIGIDISEKMLAVGRKKILKKKLENIIRLEKGDSENIKFPSNNFDIVTAAFGVRNFENLEKGLSEMYRVLKNNGEILILEFSKPQNFPIKNIYNFYFKNILPFFGKLFSKDKSAYKYLPDSVDNFPYGKKFKNILENIGFKNCRLKTLSFGIATIYHCKKTNH